MASILVTCYTNDRYSSNIDCNSDDTSSDFELKNIIYKAKEKKLLTSLRIYVDLLDGQWRAHWNPSNKKLAFKNLQKVLLKYSRFAEENKVELLIIGAEYTMLTLPQYTKNWISLINKLRNVYFGKITYGANWMLPNKMGSEYQQVKFWNYLDYIGIDHYQGLSKDQKPTQSILESHHLNTFKKYSRFAQAINKPWIITETGIPGAAQGVYSPWNWKLAAPSNQKRQKNAYFALLKAFKKSSAQGIFIWRTLPQSSLPKNYLPQKELGYQLEGRPAWKIIRTIFKGH